MGPSSYPARDFQIERVVRSSMGMYPEPRISNRSCCNWISWTTHNLGLGIHWTALQSFTVTWYHLQMISPYFGIGSWEFPLLNCQRVPITHGNYSWNPLGKNGKTLRSSRGSICLLLERFGTSILKRPYQIWDEPVGNSFPNPPTVFFHFMSGGRGLQAIQKLEKNTNTLLFQEIPRFKAWCLPQNKYFVLPSTN